MLARLRVQVIERRIGSREGLDAQLVAELKIKAFKEKGIVIQYEDRCRVKERCHDVWADFVARHIP
jgi:hypothetical protein